MFRSQILWVESSWERRWRRLKRLAPVSLIAVLPMAAVLAAVSVGAALGYRSAMEAPMAILPTETPVPAAVPAITAASVYHEPDSLTIDGLRTYGQEQPLSESELTGLVEFLNADPLPMDEDAYYVTFLASATAYRDFPQNYGESLPSYLLRHAVWMDRELREADPPVSGGLVARRLLVVEDGIWDSDWDVRGLDYMAHGLEDSDGAWSFIDPPYFPEQSAFYDWNLGLDFGLMHEWTHAVLKLPDYYALDFHPQYDTYNVLEGIPEVWRFYPAGGRPGLSHDDFAGGSGRTLRRFSSLWLADRRARFGRDKERLWYGMDFLNQVPAEVVWDLGPDLAGAPIAVYRSQPCPPDYPDSGASACKVLGPEPVLEGRLDERGRIAVGNLFAGFGDIVPEKEGVLFVRVQPGEDVQDVRFRWLDIRDFILATWEGFGPAVTMRFNLASYWMDPGLLDWNVSYENWEPSEPSPLE